MMIYGRCRNRTPSRDELRFHPVLVVLSQVVLFEEVPSARKQVAAGRIEADRNVFAQHPRTVRHVHPVALDSGRDLVGWRVAADLKVAAEGAARVNVDGGMDRPGGCLCDDDQSRQE